MITVDTETINFIGKKALKSYRAARKTVETAPDEMAAIENKLYSPHSAIIDGMPKTKQATISGDAWVHKISACETLHDAYEKATKLIADVDAALDTLYPAEKDMLTELFIHGESSHAYRREYCRKYKTTLFDYESELDNAIHFFSLEYYHNAKAN